MSALTLAALRHRKSISSSVITTIPIPGIDDSDEEDDGLFLYAGQGIVLYHSTYYNDTGAVIDTDEKLKVDIKSVNSDGTCTLLKSISGLDTRLEPDIAFALDDGAVMWTCTAGPWFMCNTESDDNREITWEVDELDYGYLVQIAACLHCGLVGVLPCDITTRQWELCTLKLIRSSETSSKVSHQLRLPDSFPLKKYRGAIVVLPNQHAEKDDDGFCKAHSVVVCLDGGIIFYNVPEAGISDPVKVLSHQDEYDVSRSNGRFTFSHDKKLVGMICEEKFHLWRLDSDEYVCHVLPAPFEAWPNSTCFTVGHLYSVLNCGHSVKVVASFTGEVILGFHDTGDKDNIYSEDLWGPADVTWLNDFSYYPKSGYWHITGLSFDTNDTSPSGALSLVACTPRVPAMSVVVCT